jgi:hypothetical protein
MKKIMLATVAAFAFAGAAFAGADRPLTFNTYGEYAVEAEAFEFGVGADWNTDSALSLGVVAVAVDNAGQNFDFDHLDINVGYVVSENGEVYGKVTFDDELTYAETVVGVAFSF